MRVVEFLLATAHTLTAAVWLGAMAYSIAVVQPRAARLLDAERYEELAATLAAGARWTVLAMSGVLALSGGWLATRLADRRTTPAWTTVIAVKGGLWLVALAVFAYVSWRLWPRRVFALPAELPRLYRTFRRAAWTLIAIVAGEAVLGVAAGTLFAAPPG